MDAKLIDSIELVCPECRRPGPEGMITSPLEIRDAINEAEENIVRGILACQGCGMEYPIISGVPCILRDVGGWLEQEISASPFKLDLPGKFSHTKPNPTHRTPEAERALVSAFSEFHYGEFSGRGDSLSKENGEYWRSVTNLAEKNQDSALDLGCSVGRFAFELACTNKIAVGLDIRLSGLINAERYRTEGRVAYERRVAGRKFETVETDFRPAENVLFIAGNALDPPFHPGAFGQVVGLNILDNVPAPLTLLGQMDALLRPGSALLLGSPYEWREGITHPSEWLLKEGEDSAAMLSEILRGNAHPQTGFRYAIENEIFEIAWTMRNHDRYYSRFISHVIKARKPISQCQ